jgi:hypothetical protein
MSSTANKDFWLSCGHHLLDRDEGGGLVVTDEFLKAYLARPELAPPPEACAAERALHAALFADPRRPVSPFEIAAIADADARENWQVMLGFRDHLPAHRTLEAAYVDLIRRGLRFPHLFINQLVHAILRNALDGCDDAYVLRAAETFFRPQRMTQHEGSLIAADEETISGNSATPVSPLVSMLGIPAEADIDVLNDDNAEHYFRAQRSVPRRARPHCRPARARRARRGDRAVGAAPARGRSRSRAVHGGARRDAVLVRRARCGGHAHRQRAVERRDDRRGRARPRGRAVPAAISRSRHGRRTGSRRAGLPHPGDGSRQGAADEAAESRHRPADQASGGGDMSSVPPDARIEVGIVVERVQAESQWIDYLWRPVAALAGAARHAALDRDP